jgi:hypothetical protein
MRGIQWFTLLLLAGLILFTLLIRYKDDFTRITTEWITPEKAPRYFTDPGVLRYILSFRNYRPPLNDVDYFIFAPLQARLYLQEELKRVNIRKLLESDVPGEPPVLDIYGGAVPARDEPIRLPEEPLKSGFDIGREGAVYKLVIPGTKRLIPVMELGVEPDQTEDLEKMNLTPKAKLQVIVPLNK